MGATRLSYTDRSPYTVVQVDCPDQIQVTADRYRRTDPDGMSDAQSYEYERDASAAPLTLKRGPDGTGTAGGVRFILGVRERYFDFSF